MRGKKETKQQKSEIIKEYESKGTAWLAERLYETRKRNAEIRERCEFNRREVDISSRQLKNAARILSENGITPIRLIVEYIPAPCKDCEFDECYDDWRYCGKDPKRHISTCSFWSFDISDNGIFGILADFEEFDEQVVSVKTKDGTLLWMEAAE